MPKKSKPKADPVIKIVEEAMRDCWNAIVADTGYHPADVCRPTAKSRHLIFEAKHWARAVGKRVADEVAKRGREAIGKSALNSKIIKSSSAEGEVVFDLATLGDSARWLYVALRNDNGEWCVVLRPDAITDDLQLTTVDGGLMVKVVRR